MTDDVKWYHQPIVIILLIFLALGPFGLPLAYRSPKFNTTWKIILTVLTLLFTFYLIWQTVVLVQIMMSWINQLAGTVS